MVVFDEKKMRHVADTLTEENVHTDATSSFIDIEWDPDDNVACIEKRFANLVYRWLKIEADLWRLYTDSVQFNDDFEQTADKESANND